jgi:hypothetical protein
MIKYTVVEPHRASILILWCLHTLIPVQQIERTNQLMVDLPVRTAGRMKKHLKNDLNNKLHD